MDVPVLAAFRGVTLAGEGGYQAFELGGGEKLALLFSALTALLAIGVERKTAVMDEGFAAATTQPA